MFEMPSPIEGVFGRWMWTRATDNDRLAFQIPDGFPPYIIFDCGEDDPVLAYCDAWYEAEAVARALHLADGVVLGA